VEICPHWVGNFANKEKEKWMYIILDYKVSMQSELTVASSYFEE
jgi:hypothetical protein